MERDVPMCHIEATVGEAMDALDARPGWERCVVVTDGGLVMGSVARGARGLSRPLADVVRFGPTTVRPDVGLEETRARMREHDVMERIVTDPTGRLLGVLRHSQ
jgi:CBS domain-containing protein